MFLPFLCKRARVRSAHAASGCLVLIVLRERHRLSGVSNEALPFKLGPHAGRPAWGALTVIS